MAAMHVAMMSLETGPIVLFQSGHKYGEVEKDLIAAGIDANQVTYLDPDYRRAWRQQPATFAAHMVRMLLLRQWLRLRLSAHALDYLDIICQYAGFKHSLNRVAERSWVIIGDLSPHLIALCGATRETGHRSIGWQMDYLDFKHFPVRTDIAAVLNETGVRLSRRDPATSESDVYWRPVPEIRPMRLDFENGTVGVLLNAFADEEVLERLSRLKARINRPMEVRLHPRSRLHHSPPPEGMALAPRDESLEAFTDRMSLLVCGNTSAQLKALCRGTPVVQVAGLDHLKWDHHGYLTLGLVIGFKSDDSICLDAIKNFYKKEDQSATLRKLIGPGNITRKTGSSRERIAYIPA